MVGRSTGGWLLGVGLLVVILGVPSLGVEGATYGILSNARVKIGEDAGVGGSVHSNDTIELKKGSTVTGDASAVKEVRNQGGRVLGRVLPRAAAVALPATPGKNEARALANRVLVGPIRLVDPRIDDVLFVSGAVTIEGSAAGAGTLIATGAISVLARPAGVSPPAGSGGSGPTAVAGRLSILTFTDLTMAARSGLRAAVRARGKVIVGDHAALEGSLIADKDVELARGAQVTFEPPVDTTAPALTILGPVDPFVTAMPSLDLALLYADADPGVDRASFSLTVDGVVTGEPCTVGPSTATCSVSFAGSGRHRIVASIRDLAGNLATRTLDFTAVLDVAPPGIAIEAPTDGALVATADLMVRGAVTDDGIVEALTINGSVAEAPAGRFMRAVRLQEGANAITVVARDSTSKESQRTIAVTLDSEPPRIVLRSPAALASATRLAAVEVVAEAQDEHGITAVAVAGVAVTQSGGIFARDVQLQPGANAVRVAATDGAGNVGVVDLTIERVAVPAIAIVSPPDGALILDPTVDVRGTLDDPSAVVTVNGARAAVSGTEFVLAAMPILDGANLINAVATSAAGLQSAAGITVVRDRQPPTVVIHDPADGSEVHQAAVAVTGMVNDVVVGTVNATQVTVKVNGVAAEVSNRSFLLDSLPLVVGENTIEVEGIDPSGNVGRTSVRVRRIASAGPTISIVSGDRQSARVGETLPQPLVVVLRDALGAPIAGQVVTFVADGTDGAFAGGRREVAIPTELGGRASVVLTLGRRAGHHTVRATATGIPGEALFVARASAGEPALLVVDSGDQQVGAAGQGLRAPFAAVVTDDGFNRLEGVPVRFEVIEGEGMFENGDRALDLVTDSDGRVTARLVLGPEEGVGNNVVQARLDGGPEDAIVAFAASAVVARDPASTSVSGVVLDNTDQPVPGATVTLEGTTLTTRSDALGYFRLAGAPAGTAHLRVRGATVERPGVWPSLEFLITIISGVDNSMGRPIFLPQLQIENALAVDENTGGTLTMRDLPGFALHVAPGSVTFPGGRRDGVLTVTPVHSDKVPMPPNFGQQPRFVITLQPGGARFDPPAPVSFPNVDGLAPGQVTELYSFDHDLARFVSIGPGTVTGDGTRIESDLGVGIAKAGWHGGGDPARPGTCHDCGDCRKQSGGACVADDNQVPKQKAPDDCKRELCRGGSVESDPTNQESAMQVAGNCYEELCPRPHRAVDLADAPAELRCCGDPTKPLPGGIDRGVLTGIYDPEAQCCVEGGLFIISKKAPIDLSRCPKPVAPENPIDFDHDGCSVPVFAQVLAATDTLTPYSGDPDEPTPPARGDALFSRVGLEDPPNGPCDRHDRCYQTCGSGQSDCDRAFGSDLVASCAAVGGTFTTTGPGGFDIVLDRKEICEAWASRYAVVVSNTGAPAYRGGQSSHCDCECS